MVRLAYLVTHPIQYHAPLLKKIADEPDIYLKTFFASDLSARKFRDEGFGKMIEWDLPLLEGYDHEFLPAVGGVDVVSSLRPFNYGLASRLRSGKFDALWVHGYARPHHWVAIATAKRLGMKILVRDEASGIGISRSWMKRLAKKSLLSWLIHTVDGFLAIGSSNKEYYRRLGIREERIFRMPYAVDNDSFQIQARQAVPFREDLRRSLSLMRGRTVILFAGKLIERKRAIDLLDAYTLLLREIRKSAAPYLLFVGDGELRSQLEDIVHARGFDSVRFLGFKNQSELPALYDLCDIFVMPTVREPWGLVVNEVMNAARPVVVSDEVGCSSDLVQNGLNGATFRARNVSDLHRALAETLADNALLSRMGQHSLHIISQWSFNEDVQGLRAGLGMN